MQNGMSSPDNAGAGATDYMHMLGLVLLAYMWAKMAQAAKADQDAGRAEFMQGKQACALFFAQRILPETATRLARITSGAANVMSLPADLF